MPKNTSTEETQDEEIVEPTWTSSQIVKLLQQNYPHIMQPPTNGITFTGNLECFVHCEELTGGCENDSVKVTISFSTSTNDMNLHIPVQDYIFRIYNDSNKTREYISFELNTLFFLTYARFPVPYVILPTELLNKFIQSNYQTFPDMKEAIIEFDDGRFCTLCSFVSGKHTYKHLKKSTQIQQVASFLGNLHKLTQFNGYSMFNLKTNPEEMMKIKEGEKKLTFVYMHEAMEDVIKHINEMKEKSKSITNENNEIEKDKFEKMIHFNNKVNNALDELQLLFEKSKNATSNISEEEQYEMEKELPHSIIHADIHESNVLFIEDENGTHLSGVVDWDDCYYGCQLMDFVKGLYFWCISAIITPENEHQQHHFDLFDNNLIELFKTTYFSTRGYPLTIEEKKCFKFFAYLIYYAQIDYFIHCCSAEQLYLLPHHLEEHDSEPSFVLQWFIKMGKELEGKLFSLILDNTTTNHEQ
ncbi:hypothetical protein ABK040_008213 [Willaertia magna]